MRMRDVMSRRVRAVNMDDAVQTMVLIFDNADFRHPLAVGPVDAVSTAADRLLSRGRRRR